MKNNVTYWNVHKTCVVMGVRRNFSRGGQSRHFAYLFLVVGDVTQMDVSKKENVQCYGNSCIQCFPCKKTLQWANVCFSEHGFL